MRIRQAKKEAKIWQIQTSISQQLLCWAGLNVIGGMVLQQHRSKFWRGVAMQAMMWGTINGMIAVIGNFFTNRRRMQPDANKRAVVRRERQTLLRLLWINAVLDVVYMFIGVLLALTRGRRNLLMRGNGWGVVIQGCFLFLFDSLHALMLSTDEENGRR